MILLHVIGGNDKIAVGKGNGKELNIGSFGKMGMSELSSKRNTMKGI